MEDLSIFEKLKIIFKMIINSPLFLALFIIFILTLIIIIIGNKVKNKLVKIVSLLGYLSILAFLIIQYGEKVLLLCDNFMEKVFTAIYFPSLISYICMMIISALIVVITILGKKMDKFIRCFNMIVFIIIEFLFILTVDKIVSQNIDIYAKTAIFSNKDLLVLIQTSMAVFAIWLIILVIAIIVSVITKSITGDKVKENKKIISKENVIVKDTKIKKENKVTDEQQHNTINNIEVIKEPINNNQIKTEEQPAVNEKLTKEVKHENKFDNTQSDFKPLSEEDFAESYNNKKKDNKYKKYFDYLTYEDKYK